MVIARRLMLVLASTALAAGVLTGCDGTSQSYNGDGGATSSSGRGDLQVGTTSLQTGEYGIKNIVGTLHNTGNKEYGYVQVSFNLYDDAGYQVGSAMDNINNLEADGTWKFKAIVIESRAVSYKLKEVTGF